ncbi:unnamed protein product [Ceratitis capitata]|uniref:(Mediterranean fruit fly) hypothetical protein n=1 Tax=Ceratitis capitata TaxID=7213 RepID=A0A811V066_CERCA|nr:unnamed protein product [Ceratitis capitata]
MHVRVVVHPWNFAYLCSDRVCLLYDASLRSGKVSRCSRPPSPPPQLELTFVACCNVGDKLND